MASAELPIREGYPDMRAAIVRMSAALDSDIVDGAVDHAVFSFGGLLEREIELRMDELSGVINFPAVYKKSPHWLNFQEYVFEVLRLNSLVLWERLILDADSKDEGLYEELKNQIQAVQGPDGVNPESTLEVADGVASGNTVMFSGTTMGLFMGALLGQSFEGCSTFNPGLFTAQITPTRAGIEVGKSFGIPASDPDDLLARLKSVFPPATSAVAGEGYQTIVDTNGFTGTHYLPEGGGFRRISPGSDITRLIYEGYGKLLSSDDYPAEFKSRVVDPRSR